jgi:hypothetical protein
MVTEADAYKAPMFMVLKIPQHPRNYRNMAASSNDSKLHVLKHDMQQKFPAPDFIAYIEGNTTWLPSLLCT